MDFLKAMFDISLLDGYCYQIKKLIGLTPYDCFQFLGYISIDAVCEPQRLDPHGCSSAVPFPLMWFYLRFPGQ